MAWITTESATLPSQVTAAGTDNTAPQGAITVPVNIAAQAVCNPSAYILHSKEVTQAIGDTTTTTTEYSLSLAPLTLATAQQNQIALLQQAYQAAIQAPVSYTSKGGVTKTYQADPGSISNLQGMLLAFQAAAAVPAGFYWVAADNTQVPFTYADMQGLAQAIGEQGAAAFQRLQVLKAAIKAATSVSAVQAITW